MPKFEQHHRRITFWIATGGTAAVILALWLMVLPTQFESVRAAGAKGATRWSSAQVNGGVEDVKTFSEIITEQRLLLDAMEQKSAEARPANDDLRFRIEDATVAKSVTTK